MLRGNSDERSPRSQHLDFAFGLFHPGQSVKTRGCLELQRCGAVDLGAEIAVEQLEFQIELAESSGGVGPGLGSVIGQTLLLGQSRDVGRKSGALTGDRVFGLSNRGVFG